MQTLLSLALNVSKFHHHASRKSRISAWPWPEPKPLTDPENILGVTFLPSQYHSVIIHMDQPLLPWKRTSHLLAGLILPESVAPLNLKHLRIRLHFTPTHRCQVLLLNRASVGEPSAKTDCACQTHHKALDLLETPRLTRIELESKWQLIYTKGFSYWIEQPELAHSPLL